ncbi:MAG TPA: sulfatase-like hydrolase/transferase [Thermoanaerobaculia bacterium]
MKRAALFFLCAVALAGCRRHEGETYRGAPVILISIDTLRADHLPMFGYRSVDTPALDALRRDGVLFTNAYSQVPLTLPSHAAMLTGLLPPGNHVRNNIGYSLDAKVPTLPALLHDAGYATGAAVSAFVLRGSAGLAKSFDFYDDKIENVPGKPVSGLQRSGAITESIAKEWISQHDGGPFFFFLHLYEPHSPYTPPEPFFSRYASKYDGEIATADSIVGDFIAFLKSRGIYDKAIIVFLSDHGEGLSQHGDPEHGIFLYREEIHVPLVVKLPKSARAGQWVGEPVALVDLLPTITQLTATTAPAHIDGISLFAKHDPHRRVYSETLYPRIHLGWSDLYSLTDHRFEFIRAPRAELYDVVRDPAETTNIINNERRAYSSMRTDLDRMVPSSLEMPSRVDPEEAKKLTALGYLGSTAAPSAGPLPDPKDRVGEIGDLLHAGTLAHEGHDAEAIPLFEKVLGQNPRLADGWSQYGASLEREGRYGDAIAAYKRTADLSPELAPWLSIGSLLLKMKRYDEAAQHAQLAMKGNPGGAHMLLARIALAKKDARTAENEARAAQDDPYSGIPASVLIARIWSEEGRAADALSLIDSTAQRAQRENSPPVEGLQYVRGDALARMQRFPEAAEAFRAEIGLFPHDLETYSRLAVVTGLLGGVNGSRQVMESMVRANPNKVAREYAAHTLESLGDRAGAAQFH